MIAGISRNSAIWLCAFIFTFCFVKSILADCPDYAGVTEVTVDSYTSLTCAIAAQVPNIEVNDSIIVTDVIDVLGNNPLHLYASSDVYVLQVVKRTQMFNISNANVTISKLFLSGRDESRIPYAGGIITATNSVLSIVNSTLNYGNSICSGAIYAQNTELFIERSHFYNNTMAGTSSCAGAVTLSGGSLYMRRTLFQQNLGYRGGALSTTDATIDIADCDFTRNFATSIGGAVSLLRSTGRVSSTRTYYNAAADSGGAYNIDTCSSVAFSAIRCSRDYATNYGGCMNVQQSAVSIVGSTSNGTVANYGGAFHITVLSAAVFDDSVFSDAHAGLAGGILEVSKKSTVEMYRVSFYNNSAGGNGGVLSISAASTATIDECLFVDNIISDIPYPLSAGGSMYCFLSYINITNSEVRRSYATTASILYAYHCDVHISSSQFYDCESESAGIYIGQESVLHFSNSTYSGHTATLDTSGIKCEEAIYCEITQSVFSANTALDRGILSFFLTPSIEVHDSQFIGNEVQGTAGAVYVYSIDQAYIFNCQFINNTAHIYAGAVFVEIGSTLYLANSIFEGNSAVAGGALYVFDNSNLFMHDVALIKNYALDSGGTVYIGAHSFFNASDVVITGSVAPAGGGVYGSYYASVNFLNVNVTNCFSAFSGGAISLFDKSHLRIIHCSFNSNRASLGGALFGAYKTTIYAESSNILDNSAFESGGGMYISVNSLLLLSKCLLRGNRALINGGVAVLQTSATIVTESVHYENTSPTGGCYTLFLGAFNATSSQFFRNGGSTVIDGGVLYSNAGGFIHTKNNTFSDNKADSGGVFSIDHSELHSQDDVFSGCVAKLQGGCVYAHLKSSLFFQGSTFRNNIDSRVGGSVMQINSGELWLTGVTVADNYAIGLAPVAIVGASVTVLKSSFERNHVATSNAKGGAIYISCEDCDVFAPNKRVLIEDSTFANNTAVSGSGGAFFIELYEQNVSINRCTFSNNFATNGGAVSSSLAALVFREGAFYNNSAYEGGGAVFWIYYNNKLQTTFEGNTSFSGNSAAYGPDYGTNMVKLTTTGDDDDEEDVSGQPLPNPLNVYILDYYGQTVTNSTLTGTNSVTVYCSVYNNTGTIRGSTIVSTIDGIASFTSLVLTSNPGSFITLSFTIPSSGVEEYFLTINFRDCKRGEITFNAGDGLSGCQKCGKGTYSFQPHDSSCNECPDNCDCPGGDKLDLDKNYWRVDKHSDTILQCSVPDVCEGGDDVDDQCAEGQTGPYCDVCEDGYVKNQQGVCYSCDNSTSLVMEIISTVLFLLGIVLLIVLIKYRKKIMQWYSKKVDEISKNRKFQTLRVKGKIVVAFSQIVFQIGPAMNIVFPISFRSYVGFYSIFQLDVLNLPDVQCGFKANYYTSLLFSTISPFVVFAVAAIGIQIMVFRAYRLNSRNPYYTVEAARRDTITVSFLISYFVLVDVSTKIFQVFQCETFDDGNSYLVADYSIDCSDPNRAFYVAYGAVMILIYPVGIPLIYAVILFRNRHLINPDWRLVVDGKEKKIVSNKVIQAEKIKVRNTYPEIYNIRNLYDSYVPKRWYFELFDCARRLLLGAVPVLILRGTIMQIIIVLIVSLASVATFMHFSPYIHDHDNKLAVVAQWSITSVLISALIIRVNAVSDSHENNVVIGVTLILLNVLVLFFAVATALLNTKAAKLEAEDMYDPHEEDMLEKDDDASIPDDDEWQERFRFSQQLEQQRQVQNPAYVDELNGDIPLNPMHSGRKGDIVAPASKRGDGDSDDEFSDEELPADTIAEEKKGVY